MIVNIHAKNWPAIIDEVVQNYDASLPVKGDDDLIVGSVWIASGIPKLVVLDVVQPGAIKLWSERGDNVIIINHVPEQETEGLDVLMVTDDCQLEGYDDFCVLGNTDDEQLIAYIEEAIGL